MDNEPFARRRVTIVNMDMVGYSRMMAQDSRATIDSWLSHVALMRLLVGAFGGRVLDAVGDNLSAEFEHESDALRCAIQLQRRLAANRAQLPGSARVHIRIGIHTGEALQVGERVFGTVVNLAARLQGAAETDGILISEDVAEAVDNALRERLVSRGASQFKNIPFRVGTFAAYARP